MAKAKKKKKVSESIHIDINSHNAKGKSKTLAEKDVKGIILDQANAILNKINKASEINTRHEIALKYKQYSASDSVKAKKIIIQNKRIIKSLEKALGILLKESK